MQQKIQQLKSKKMRVGISLTPKYMEFLVIGEVVQGIFLGFKPITKNNDIAKIQAGEPQMLEINCAVWVDEDKNVWMNGGVSFIQSFSNISVGQAFEVAYCRKKEKTKIYDIKPLF